VAQLVVRCVALACANPDLFTSVYGSSVHVLPGLTFLLDCTLMAVLLGVHLVVTYHMTKSSSSSSSSSRLQSAAAATHYGSVETTALDSAATAETVDTADDDGISHKTAAD